METINVGYCQISFDGVSLLKVSFSDDDVVLEIPEIKRLGQEIRKLVKGKKFLSLVDARANITLNKEAREYAAKDPVLQDLRIAQAVLIDSLPMLLLANFYSKINAPKHPFKVFRKEEDALEWLKQEWEKYQQKHRNPGGPGKTASLLFYA